MIQTSFFKQPEENKPIKIIRIDSPGFQPRKVEEIKYRDCANTLPDTFMLYPTGGYHPFYGIPDTFPRYQLPIWPYIKRIKYPENYFREKLRQLKPYFHPKRGYVCITIQKKGYFLSTDYRREKNGRYYTFNRHLTINLDMHGLVANAWIPNPENKPQIMHINDDPTNYLPENLKWGTPGENMKGVKRNQSTMEQKYLSLVIKGIIKG